jgi:hypothetical protein
MIVRFAPLLGVFALLASPACAQDGVEDAPPVDEPARAGDSPEGAPPSAPVPAPAIQRAIPPSPFSLEQRNGWLMQCRNTFLQAGASLAGALGQPDACETQLLEYERNYVPSASGVPPTILVRVPVTRQPAAPAPIETPEEEE